MALGKIELLVLDDNICGLRHDDRIYVCGCSRLEKA